MIILHLSHNSIWYFFYFIFYGCILFLNLKKIKIIFMWIFCLFFFIIIFIFTLFTVILLESFYFMNCFQFFLTYLLLNVLKTYLIPIYIELISPLYSILFIMTYDSKLRMIPKHRNFIIISTNDITIPKQLRGTPISISRLNFHTIMIL